MASVNHLNVYGKISQSHLEDQNPRPKIALRRSSAATVIIIFSAILLFTLVIVLTLVALMLEQPRKDKDPTVTVEPIKTICNVTRYPEACFTDPSSLNASKNPDPESFLDLSLRVSITHLSNLVSSIKSLNNLQSQPGLKDCLTLFDDALSRLNDSVSAMNAHMGLSKEKTSDIQTWISAAITDQDTCNDGLEEMGWTAGDEVKSRGRSFKESLSNSLAIVANMQNLVQKIGITMH